MVTDIHNKDFALRLVLKERLGGTRKWPIAPFWILSTDSILYTIHRCHDQISRRHGDLVVNRSLYPDQTSLLLFDGNHLGWFVGI